MGLVILTLANLGAFGIVFDDVREYYVFIPRASKVEIRDSE